MRTKKRLIFASGVLIACISIVSLYRHNHDDHIPKTSFVTIKGETINSADLKQHPVIVSFWSTDCRTCIQEIPILSSLHARYNHRGLKIIAIAMSYDPPNRVLEIATAMQIPYSITLDPTDALAKEFGGITFTPTTLLISPTGKIEWKNIGKLDLEKIEKQLESFI